MAKQHYKPEQIISKLQEAEVELGRGMAVPLVLQTAWNYRQYLLSVAPRIRWHASGSSTATEVFGIGDFGYAHRNEQFYQVTAGCVFVVFRCNSFLMKSLALQTVTVDYRFLPVWSPS